MSLVYLLFAVLVLAGVFLNVQMLWSSIKKDKRKYTFLQNCRHLVICQFVYQITIICVNSIEAWIELHDVQQRTEHCSVRKVLSNSMVFFMVCNLLVILAIESESRKLSQHRKSLLLYFTLCSGCIGTAVILGYSCLPQEFVFELAIIIIYLVIIFLFLFLNWRRYKQVPDQSTSNDSVKTSSLWNSFKETRETVLFMALFLMCFAVMVVVFPPSPFHESELNEKNKVFQKITFQFITNAVIPGIALPVTIIRLIDSSYEEIHQRRRVYGHMHCL